MKVKHLLEIAEASRRASNTKFADLFKRLVVQQQYFKYLKQIKNEYNATQASMLWELRNNISENLSIVVQPEIREGQFEIYADVLFFKKSYIYGDLIISEAEETVVQFLRRGKEWAIELHAYHLEQSGVPKNLAKKIARARWPTQ